MSKVRAIPEGMHSVTPQLTLKGCAEALEFFKKAFDAEEVMRAPDPSGAKVWHAMFRIGDSTLFCNDDFPEMGTTPRTSQLWIYTDNVDAAFQRAVDAGAKMMMPVADMFWGDRMGRVGDRWGNEWTIVQHTKDMTPDDLKKAEADYVAKLKK